MSNVRPFAITFYDSSSNGSAEDQFNEYCNMRPVTQTSLISVTVNVVQPVEGINHSPQTQITLIHWKKAD